MKMSSSWYKDKDYGEEYAIRLHAYNVAIWGGKNYS